MKNVYLLLVCFFVTNLTFSQIDIPNYQLQALKEVYKWGNEKFLVINFTQPKFNCHYDNYQKLNNKKKWLDDNVYNDIDMNDCRSIYVFSDKEAAKKIIDNNTYFEDHNNYFLNNFFNLKENCYGLLIIRQDGKFSNLVGEYLKEDVKAMLDSLK